MFRLLTRGNNVSSNHMDSLSPLDRLISYWLAFARSQNATAIIFGMPSQIPNSVRDDNHAEFRQHLLNGPQLPSVGIVNSASVDALTESSRLKSAAGWKSVPIWLEHAGQLYPMHGPPIEVYLALLSSIQERLVSLDASEDSPKPMRYIEYDSTDSTCRCFAEVQLCMLEDNTFRIEIVRHLGMPRSVRAVASVY